MAPFVVALAAGVNSNPSSRERFLRTANPRKDPNSCIHYDVIWRPYSSSLHLQEDDTKSCRNKQDLNPQPVSTRSTRKYIHHTFTQGVAMVLF